MKTILFIFAIFVCIAIALLYSKQNWQTNAVTKIPTAPQREVYIGAWVEGFWDNETKKLTPTTLTNFEQVIGKKVALANIYSEWTYLSNKDLITVLNKLSDEKWTPIISSNPSFFDECPKGNGSLYKTIADGRCDAFLRKVAINLRSYEKPILLRFAWEMNLPDMYWSVTKLESTPEEFTAAWRHFHEIVKDEGADNVQWVLSFNTSNPNTIPYAELYPGDEYVDWVAIDGYNWGNSHEWSGWANFNGVFRNSYNELIAISDKPVMLSEVNSAPTGGNKAEWLHDMLTIQVPEEFPKVEAIVFFNENKTTGESVDWRIEKSPEYVTVVKEALKAEIYKSSFP